MKNQKGKNSISKGRNFLYINLLQKFLDGPGKKQFLRQDYARAMAVANHVAQSGARVCEVQVLSFDDNGLALCSYPRGVAQKFFVPQDCLKPAKSSCGREMQHDIERPVSYAQTAVA